MKKTLLIISLMFCTLLGYSQEGENFLKGEFISKATGDTLLYRYLTPQNPQKGKKYPIVIFLHGSGERGNDNQAQLFHGSGQFLNPVNRENYPAYVLFPQGSQDKFGVFDEPFESEEPQDMPVNPDLSNTMQTLKELIEHYSSLPDADQRRVYIMGISMGGMGTYEMVARYPQMFAAAIPICGSVNPQRIRQNSAGGKKSEIPHLPWRRRYSCSCRGIPTGLQSTKRDWCRC